MKNNYDVIVVGAGHAGCEAGLAAARLGKRVLMLTIEMESVAMMPCNPAIGGTGKGQLVREIDALGGEMGLHIDKTFIQSRMLNRSKGPAVWSPRAQADKQRYHEEMIRTLEAQPGLDLVEGEVVDLVIESAPARQVTGVALACGERCCAPTVILATGTYLGGLLHISDRQWRSGPSGLKPSYALAENLRRKNFPLRRFKTGTPARAAASTLDYEKLQEQKGDEQIEPFSFLNQGKDIGTNRISCWLTWTNPRGHKIVADNIEKTAPYGGHTTGTGPRYCLSIEDKVDRFPERERHQLFLEPESLLTDDVYIQGMSTSLPTDIQERFYRSIAGLENAEFTKWAYSIEYDCLDPLTLAPSMAYRGIAGLYSAGQFNGTSGYEEAAAQGLIAGINAARYIDGKEPWTPGRDEAYIGVLIDDLVTKGTDEPYRIMTSRAEFRLVLRQDNADLRLTGHGHRLGLATPERYEQYKKNKTETEAELTRLRSTYVIVNEAKESAHLIGKKSQSASDDLSEQTAKSPANTGAAPIATAAEPSIAPGSHGATPRAAARISLADLLKRPEVTYESLAALDIGRPINANRYAARQAEIQIKYEGYIKKQTERIERFKKLEGKKIPENTDYRNMKGLRLEAAEKLDKQRPPSVGMASRISGVSPADINVLLIHLARSSA